MLTSPWRKMEGPSPRPVARPAREGADAAFPFLRNAPQVAGAALGARRVGVLSLLPQLGASCEERRGASAPRSVAAPTRGTAGLGGGGTACPCASAASRGSGPGETGRTAFYAFDPEGKSTLSRTTEYIPLCLILEP